MQTFDEFIKEKYSKYIQLDEGFAEQPSFSMDKMIALVKEWQADNQPVIGSDWSKPDEAQTIHVPDDLDPLIANVSMQIGFIRNKIISPNQGICQIVRIAEKHFHKKWFK